MEARIVGTSHVARTSAKRIKEAFEAFAPDVIAVELDASRLSALLQNQRATASPALIRSIGLRGYLFAVIGGWLQRRLGRVVNVAPGQDMLAAVKLARQHEKPLLLIDRDVRVTLRRLSAVMGWRELKQFLKDLWEGLVKREHVTITLSDVPDEALIERLLREFRKRYPRPYRVLVTERNKYMVDLLRRYHEQHVTERILVVVGAGHVAGMQKLIDDSN